MNCDEAFDFLTDPSRRDSAVLHAHFAHCPRCRQMRDVLEPALDLFDGPTRGSSAASDAFTSAYEADTDSKRSGVLSPESIQIAEQAAAQLSPRRSLATVRRWPVSAICRYAAVFLMGTLLALGFTTARAPEQNGQRSLQTPAATQCTWQNQASEVERQDIRARQVVQSCVACHLHQQRVAPKNEFDRFLAPEVILPEVNDSLPTEAAVFPSLGPLEWHVAMRDAKSALPPV